MPNRRTARHSDRRARGSRASPTLFRRGFERRPRRRFGDRGLRPIAVIERALAVAPGRALALVDLPVVIGVDTVEAFAEVAVAVRAGQFGEPVVVGFGVFEPGFLCGREAGPDKLDRKFALAPLDLIEPPVAVLFKGDRVT